MLDLVGKRVQNVGTFIEAEATGNKGKYTSEGGKVHRIQILKDKEGKALVYEVPQHSWGESRDEYGTAICVKNIVSEKLGLDGTCPVCDRVKDVNEFMGHIRDLLDRNCKLTGQEREDYLKKQSGEIYNKFKVGQAKSRVYVAVAQYNTDDKGQKLVDSENPYTIKIASWTVKTLAKFKDSCELSFMTDDIGGVEFFVKYPDTKDAMQLVLNMTVSAVPETAKLSTKPEVVKKLEADLADYDFMKAMEVSRPELEIKNVATLKREMKSKLKVLDNYKAELASNPDAELFDYLPKNVQTLVGGRGAAPTQKAALENKAEYKEADLTDLDADLGLEDLD